VRPKWPNLAGEGASMSEKKEKELSLFQRVLDAFGGYHPRTRVVPLNGKTVLWVFPCSVKGIADADARLAELRKHPLPGIDEIVVGELLPTKDLEGYAYFVNARGEECDRWGKPYRQIVDVVRVGETRWPKFKNV
jgi:hypothetical protein